MSDKRPVESVWDYPRPPALERCDYRLRVYWPADDGCDETVIADTTEGVRDVDPGRRLSEAQYRVLETSHPPTYYIPRKDVNMASFQKNSRTSFCEWKGSASYYDVKNPVGGTVSSRAWTYEAPSAERFKPIAGYLAFYVGPWKCEVDGEEATAQPGDFYGSWMTSWISGGKKGVKGGPGTWGW